MKTPELLSGAGKPVSQRRRSGKVASLPRAMREEVNTWLLDGVIYSDITKRLAERGFKAISIDSVCSWYKGGYQDWLRDRERIDEMVERRLGAIELTKKVGRRAAVILTDANELELASRINEALAEFEPAALRNVLAEDPKKFFEMGRLIASQSNEMCKRKKVELEQRKNRNAEAKAKAHSAGPKDKGGLTEETLREIEEAAKLL
jgi:hypothetical protein